MLILSLSLLTGCANSTRYTEAALSWENAPTHLLLAALGSPTFFYPAEDRGDILFWHFKRDYGLGSYVHNAKEKLLGRDSCTSAEMKFSEKTLCRSQETSTVKEQSPTALFTATNAYDCQIVATLSEDGSVVSKIDVLAEGNCDMLQFDSYRQVANRS